MQLASRGRAVVCRESGGVLAVDFVMEPLDCSTAGDPRAQCCLLSVHCSQRRGGALSRYARKYMQRVQQICNRDMNFFPRVLSMCIYAGGCKMYVRDVGIY